MAGASEFSRACITAARDLRRLPKDLRKEAGQEVKTRVTDPLAASIRAAASGPYGPQLSAAVKTRVDVDPKLVVGGARPKLSGGAGPRDTFYGVEFGLQGRNRQSGVGSYSRKSGQVRSHSKRTTQQFVRNRRPFLYPTVSREAGKTFERWLSVLDPFIERWNAGS